MVECSVTPFFGQGRVAQTNQPTSDVAASSRLILKSEQSGGVGHDKTKFLPQDKLHHILKALWKRVIVAILIGTGNQYWLSEQK